MYKIIPVDLVRGTLPDNRDTLYVSICKYQDGKELQVFLTVDECIEWLQWSAKSYNGSDITSNDIKMCMCEPYGYDKQLTKLVDAKLQQIKNGAVTKIHNANIKRSYVPSIGDTYPENLIKTTRADREKEALNNLNEACIKQAEESLLELSNRLETDKDEQVGGNHYRKTKGEQHWDRLIRLFGFDKAKYYFMGSITKYIERHEDKQGLQDLEKAYHFLGKLIKEYKINEAKKKEGAK